MSYKRILIVADDSPSSLKAVRYGYDLAKQLDAIVALVSVSDHAMAEGNVDAGVFPEQAAADRKKNIEEFLNGLKRQFAAGIETMIFSPEGDVKETVLGICQQWQGDMIVAGTHGRKGLNRLLMGSMAEGILRDSKVPVLVVPMDKEVQ